MLWSAPRLLERHGFESELAPSGAPRGSSAEARRKLRESTAEAQLIHSYAARCGSRSGYFLNFAYTVEQLENYDAKNHRNA